jgi:hypothetical protein
MPLEQTLDVAEDKLATEEREHPEQRYPEQAGEGPPLQS